MKPHVLVVAALLAFAAPVEAAEPFRVETHDVYVNQCRANVCATLQVTRSIFSSGVTDVTLFFSAYDQFGQPIAVPGFPTGFTLVPTTALTINRQGTQATFAHLGVVVSWIVSDEYFAESTQTDITREKDPETGAFIRRRVSEKSHQVSATVDGAIGPVLFGPVADETFGEYANAFITVRKTLSRTRHQ
jgi:hypothetical protein